MFIKSIIVAFALISSVTTQPTRGSSAGIDPNRKAPNAGSYNNQALISKLLTLPLQSDRIDALKDGDFVFDFVKIPGEAGQSNGNAGRTVAANRKTMPALIGTGSGMTMGFLGPCGFNTPHVHPRGTELNVVVVGSLVTTMILENNARVVHNHVRTYQMTVFPQGGLHQEFNPDCGETVFVAAFNNEDFGTGQIMDNYFKLNSDVIAAGLGISGGAVIDGRDIDQFKKLIPKNVAIGVESCLKKCGFSKRK